jgi:hypothetical protein
VWTSIDLFCRGILHEERMGGLQRLVEFLGVSCFWSCPGLETLAIAQVNIYRLRVIAVQNDFKS